MTGARPSALAQSVLSGCCRGSRQSRRPGLSSKRKALPCACNVRTRTRTCRSRSAAASAARSGPRAKRGPASHGATRVKSCARAAAREGGPRARPSRTRPAVASAGPNVQRARRHVASSGCTCSPRASRGALAGRGVGTSNGMGQRALSSWAKNRRRPAGELPRSSGRTRPRETALRCSWSGGGLAPSRLKLAPAGENCSQLAAGPARGSRCSSCTDPSSNSAKQRGVPEGLGSSAMSKTRASSGSCARICNGPVAPGTRNSRLSSAPWPRRTACSQSPPRCRQGSRLSSRHARRPGGNCGASGPRSAARSCRRRPVAPRSSRSPAAVMIHSRGPSGPSRRKRCVRHEARGARTSSSSW
mmetsp:Transcript_84221/g.238638  ORF Transcript_84221/g.238638 Transcript_84221/m.238638 type:complete len:359 (+) Transcript_84221:1816-2892(+)